MEEKMTSYKGTMDGAEMIDLLSMVFPSMHPEYLEEVLSKGVAPPRNKFPNENSLDMTKSKLECVLLPYAPNPILLIKDERGEIKGIEFHAVRSSTGRRYELFGLSEQKVDFLRPVYEEVKK